MLQRIVQYVRVEQSRDTRFSPSLEASEERKRVVIVGAGFGGLSAAKALGGADLDVTLIDQRNHHLFQPLLYQVATAGLSPADIAAPIRHNPARSEEHAGAARSGDRRGPGVRAGAHRVGSVDCL
jgi:glycine/D-amino acid oxidase-like deaminating enzyme